MHKGRVRVKKSENSIKEELELLSRLKHPFIVNLHYAFQDEKFLYMVTDLMEGGDLRHHMKTKKDWTEDQTKFILANVIAGLEYMHHNGVIHRDIKPENLLIGNDGYISITDMGVSRMWDENNADDTSGTPGYMAPEVMCRQNHNHAIDFYALGVIGYEMMLGHRPY